MLHTSVFSADVPLLGPRAVITREQWRRQAKGGGEGSRGSGPPSLFNLVNCTFFLTFGGQTKKIIRDVHKIM